MLQVARARVEESSHEFFNVFVLAHFESERYVEQGDVEREDNFAIMGGVVESERADLEIRLQTLLLFPAFDLHHGPGRLVLRRSCCLLRLVFLQEALLINLLVLLKF